MGSLFLIGPSSTEPEQGNCSFQVCYTLIYPTVPSFTRADTVVPNVTTKKVNEQYTKTFPKCYVGRNGKRNQQKLQLQDTKSCRQNVTDLGAMTSVQQIMVS